MNMIEFIAPFDCLAKPKQTNAEEITQSTKEPSSFVDIKNEGKTDQNNNNNRKPESNTEVGENVVEEEKALRKADNANVKNNNSGVKEKSKTKPIAEREPSIESVKSKSDISDSEEMKRRSTSPSSLSSSFKILPPIKKESLEDKPVESFNFNEEGDLSDFCQVRLRNFSSRTLDLMLLEMRKMDRDREKIIHPATVENLVHKYNVPITPCLDNLLLKFEDKNFNGLVNYEDMMQYLQNKKHVANKNSKSLQEYFEVDQPLQQPRDQTVTLRKGRTSTRQTSAYKPKKRSKSWTEEKENDLITDLAQALGDQFRQVERLAEVMRGKDHYGNDQLSGQQIQDSLRQVGIRIDKTVLNKWIKSADMIGKGIFSIPVLLETMTNAARVAENGQLSNQSGKMARRHKSDISKSSGNLNQRSQPQDDTWKHILDLNAYIPKQKSKSTNDDREIRLKNVMRLKSAMYSSYNQHQGYLPPKDVVQLSLAYSTVFHLKLDMDDLRDAVQKCLGGRNSLVNIETFIKYILDVVL